MQAYKDKAILVSAPEQAELLKAAREAAAALGIETQAYSREAFLDQAGHCMDFADHVVVICGDNEVGEYVNQAKTLNFSLGVIPVPGSKSLYDWFKLPRKRAEAIDLAFSADTQAIDILRCNNEVALGMVMLGETPFLDQRSKTYRNRQGTLWQHLVYWVALLWASIRNLSLIKPFAVTLTTRKGKTINTAITGLVAIENDVNCAPGRLINTTLSVQDSKVSIIVISPKSIVEYLSFLFSALFRGEKPLSKLPSAVSYIKTQGLSIKAAKPLTFYVDGQRREADTIELELYPQAVQINLSDAYHDRNIVAQPAKDTMKVDNLPTNETRLEMIQSHLPLFTRALEDDFRDLFLILRENAQTHPHYISLMVLSVVVASLGLYLSSAAVIIGAMVLAPLMSPIVSLAMGLLRRERTLLSTSLYSIGLGVGLALLTAAIIAIIIPIQKITPEMAGRLHPNLLDLGVAIASGIAGGYAHARESVMKSLPGVAIAVALVPPLSVAGIGIGWWQWEVFSGAMLLFITNLVGITLAAALTFLVLGYAPLMKAKKGLALTTAMLLVISVPLTIAFHNIHQRWGIEVGLTSEPHQLSRMAVTIADPRITLSRDSIHIRADAIAPRLITAEDLEELKSQFEQRWQRRIELEVTPRLSL
ncbi:MAG: DUF389 domain-containing protein [Marinobacter sp.]|nr:DUF389 domain-containing protein [Marinobacter sp.]